MEPEEPELVVGAKTKTGDPVQIAVDLVGPRDGVVTVKHWSQLNPAAPPAEEVHKVAEARLTPDRMAVFFNVGPITVSCELSPPSKVPKTVTIAAHFLFGPRDEYPLEDAEYAKIKSFFDQATFPIA